ncbi:hypothetical protein R3P38DRAFT_3278196 [Favolaschia claudopus]|uniref:Uncharacterized protein n=1 Tax=Favolaschia claudopus TaxID=2862362 RepID=A0AAW0AIM3_9AGAR
MSSPQIAVEMVASKSGCAFPSAHSRRAAVPVHSARRSRPDCTYLARPSSLMLPSTPNPRLCAPAAPAPYTHLLPTTHLHLAALLTRRLRNIHDSLASKPLPSFFRPLSSRRYVTRSAQAAVFPQVLCLHVTSALNDLKNPPRTPARSPRVKSTATPLLHSLYPRPLQAPPSDRLTRTRPAAPDPFPILQAHYHAIPPLRSPDHADFGRSALSRTHPHSDQQHRTRLTAPDSFPIQQAMRIPPLRSPEIADFSRCAVSRTGTPSTQLIN